MNAAHTPQAAFDPGAAAGRATDAILHDTLHGTHRGVVVDSPPGAGKSTLVVRAALELADAGRPLMVIAQTNAQVDDLVVRLAEKNPELPVGRLHSSDSDPYDKALDDLTNVRKSAKAAELAGLDVVISTAAKWAHVKVDEPWRHAIVDEAYQMRSDALLAVAGLFERALFVGDPGQLDPFSIVGAEQWAGLSYDPSASAVTTLLAHNPELPQHRLPVSWRLPASAAPLVSAAFYPYTPFRSGTGHGDRRLAFAVPSDGSGPDRVLDEAAESGWGLLELPARHTPRTDPEAVRAVALVVRRLLDRGGAATSERGPRPDAAHGRPDRGRHRAPRPGGGGPGGARRAGGRGRHRGHGEPAPGARVRRDGGPAPALRPPRRHRLPPGDGPPVRPGLPPPARLRRGVPRGRHGTPGRPPVDGAGAVGRHREVPGRLGGEPRGAVASRGTPGDLAAVTRTPRPTAGRSPARRRGGHGYSHGWEANHAVLSHLAEHRVAWRP